jgi:hypothetical protein
MKSTVQVEEARSPGEQGRRSEIWRARLYSWTSISAFCMEAIGSLAVEITRSQGAKFQGIS